MDATLTFATQLAFQAGEMLEEYFKKKDLKTQFKADQTVVTEADLAADRLIADAVKTRFPDDLLLSEELRPSYSPEAAHADQAVWVVDPIDGTTNFSMGLHFWGVLIARIVNGWPETAALNFPLLDEMYTAQVGGGAFLNGERLQVVEPDPERSRAFFTCCSRTYQRYEISIPYKLRILGSAGYTFCSVARGTSIVGVEATPKIWDIAAGWLLVEEAGGVVETIDGSRPFPLNPAINYKEKEFPTLMAATPALAEKTRRQIRPK